MLWNKVNRDFCETCWVGMKFVGIQVFMRAFYDSLYQADSVFSSKVILPNKCKNYLDIEPSHFNVEYLWCVCMGVVWSFEDFPKFTQRTSY